MGRLYSTTGAGCGPIHGRGRGSDHIKVAYPVTTLTSIDFITELPESDGYDTIMVVVDSVGKWAHFFEVVTTIMAAGSANLYL